MSKLEQLLEQEEKLEKEKQEYLEADDNRSVKRIEKQIYRTRELIEIEREGGYIEMQKELKMYKDFIKRRGMEEQFNKFYEKEVKRYEI